MANDLHAKLTDLRALLASSTDPEFITLVHDEIAAIIHQMKQTNPDNNRTVVLEVRSGTGGEEAELFAAELMRMYLRYAETKSWRTAVLDKNESSLGGIKSATIEIKGYGAYPALKYEGGVHRVQRVPETEKSGRIHTSAASVVVIPEVETSEVEIKPEDIRVDVYRSSGKGGQGVNTTDSAVRITHFPSGIVVAIQDERSQLKNRDKAMKILASRLQQIHDNETAGAIDDIRREMIRSGDRSDKIRTYNFPQDRVTDHRLNQSWHHLVDIINGKLDAIVAAFEPIEYGYDASLLTASEKK